VCEREIERERYKEEQLYSFTYVYKIAEKGQRE